MHQQLVTMLELQEAMNAKVNSDWRTQGFAWYRAIWVECAELMDHYGWKWWKKQSPDIDQVVLELIDIWHFGLSIRLLQEPASSDGYDKIARDLAGDLMSPVEPGDFRTNLETFTATTLVTRAFDAAGFRQLMADVDLGFEPLFDRYVGKNVLNLFRQDHGYKEGSYQKLWSGKEDNEHLVEVLESLDSGRPDFSSLLYQSLSERYPG